ncbi:hypothetical protein CKA32_003187 [Geitlerinema sp. FC II]|nr:hypothetical protein CKA32_003187 [Geitlerinema sp. FC II]
MRNVWRLAKCEGFWRSHSIALQYGNAFELRLSHASLDRLLSKYERIPMKTGDRP